MASHQSVQDQLRYLGASPFVLMRAETKILPDLLDDDEIIKEYIAGTYAGGFGMLIATSKRLLFMDKKFFDLIVDDIPYHMISTVQFDIHLTLGRVSVFTFAKDFHFRMVPRRRTFQFVRYVQTRMRAIEQQQRHQLELLRQREAMGEQPGRY